MSAGNLHRAYGSRQVSAVTGALRRMPVSGWLFLLGFLAITGAPPFAPFYSEFNLAVSAFTSGGTIWLGVLFLVLLGGIFLAMSDPVVKMVFGTPRANRERTPYTDAFATTAPLVVALGLALVLGVWLPRPADQMIRSAAAWVEGQP